jgi:hypothetical protein
MLPGRGTTIGTVVGGVFFTIAIIGTVFFDWTWANTEGKLLPLVIGGIAAVVAVLVIIMRVRK